MHQLNLLEQNTGSTSKLHGNRLPKLARMGEAQIDSDSPPLKMSVKNRSSR
jgi:hypothetical protein